MLFHITKIFKTGAVRTSSLENFAKPKALTVSQRHFQKSLAATLSPTMATIKHCQHKLDMAGIARPSGEV